MDNARQQRVATIAAEVFEISLCLNLITPAMPKPISSTATTRPIMKMMRDRKLNFFIWHPSRPSSQRCPMVRLFPARTDEKVFMDFSIFHDDDKILRRVFDELDVVDGVTVDQQEMG